jgi:protein-disulfide isomerase
MANKKAPNWKLLPVGLILFAVGFASGTFVETCGAEEDCPANVMEADETAEESTGDRTVELDQSSDGNYFYLGSEDAPITIVEYTDYQCPFCQRYFFNTFGQILEEYVETGKVRYTVKDMALSFHSKAKPAAYATRCAGEQDRYWEMHEKIFTFQNQWSYSDDVQAQFTEYATDLGLDTAEFTTCYANAPEQYDAQIDADLAEANLLGISGTPSFTINGQVIVGAQPFETFQQVIESGL